MARTMSTAQLLQRAMRSNGMGERAYWQRRLSESITPANRSAMQNFTAGYFRGRATRSENGGSVSREGQRVVKVNQVTGATRRSSMRELRSAIRMAGAKASARASY